MGILGDKIMDDKLKYISNDDTKKKNYSLCKFKLLVERFSFSSEPTLK